MTSHTATVEAMTGQPLPHEVVKTLGTALLGITARPANGPLSNPDTASAFLPGSRVQPIHLDPGLWALVRTSQHNDRTVLCVYNVSDEPVIFEPTRYLSAADSDQPSLLFLTGAARSHGSAAAPAVEVVAHSFVWLGRFRNSHLDGQGETP